MGRVSLFGAIIAGATQSLRAFARQQRDAYDCLRKRRCLLRLYYLLTTLGLVGALARLAWFCESVRFLSGDCVLA